MAKDNFVWRRVSQKENEEIKEEAKKIMEDFSKKISKADISVEDSGEPLIERENYSRNEKNEKCPDNTSEFRKIMFENAPNKKGDYFIAEKGGWK